MFKPLSTSMSSSFTSANVMRPGSVQDSQIFRNSRISDTKMHTNALLPVDSGYVIPPYIMSRIAKQLQYLKNDLPTDCLPTNVLKFNMLWGNRKKRFPILSHPVRIPKKNLDFEFSLLCPTQWE